ncbi:MAG: RHS repeat protein [Verrucomicrobiaceae bacterium]|nr:RHS repeat protein [Verrucomicrobiaceae bacterium]
MNAAILRRVFLFAYGLLLCHVVHGQTGEQLPLGIEFTTTAVGERVCLTWDAVPGVQYEVQRTDQLGEVSFIPVTTVTAEASSCTWIDPKPAVPGTYYRLVVPVPEVTALEPPYLSLAGGTLLVRGQLLPGGARLRLSTSGQAPMSFVLEPVAGEAGLWRAVIPPGAMAGIAVGAMYAASIVSAAGDDVCVVGQVVEVTETGFAPDAPPQLPPSMISAFLGKKGYDYYQAQSALQSTARSRRGYDYYQAQTDLQSAARSRKGYDHYMARSELGVTSSRIVSRKGYEAYQALAQEVRGRSFQPKITENRRMGLPGEVCFELCPLALAVPAGPPLDCVLTYRSKVSSGSSSFFGPNWTCSYDISVSTVPANAGAAATRVLVCGGDGRCDTFIRQADGSFTCPGMFRVGRFSGNTFTLTFSDKTRWVFRPVGTAPGAGKIAAITDSFGVSVSFDYTGGLLSMVSSQFGQWLIFSRGPDGLVNMVEDHTGRVVDFAYHQASTNGNNGTLAMCSCPHLRGVPPVAGPTTFTYSMGCPDVRCDNNLLSCRDGVGRPICLYTYSSAVDPLAADFDCVVTERCTESSAVPSLVSSYELSSSGLIVHDNDPLGRVCRYTFDRQHRPVEVMEFTGFSTPGVPVTTSTNLPTGKLRTSDPSAYVTTFTYNQHHLCTRCVESDGLEMRCVYACDLNRVNCPALERGNVRVCTLQEPNGEARTMSVEYLPGWGAPEPPSAVCGNPIGGLNMKGGKNPGGGSAQGRIVQRNPVRSYFETGDKPNQARTGRDPSYAIGSEECDDGIAFLNGLPPGEPVIRSLMAVCGVEGDTAAYLTGGGSVAETLAGGLNGLPPGQPVLRAYNQNAARSNTARAMMAGGLPSPDAWGVQDHNSSRSNKSSSVISPFGGGGAGGSLGKAKSWMVNNYDSSSTNRVQDHNSSRSNKSSSVISPSGGGAGGSLGKAKSWMVNNYDSSSTNRVQDHNSSRSNKSSSVISPSGERGTGGKTKISTKQKMWSPANFRFSTRLATPSGQVYTASYDSHGACVAVRTPVAGDGCDFSFNDVGQLSSVTLQNGPGSSFRDQLVYDELSGFCTGVVCDKKTSGTGLELTQSWTLDELGRPVSFTDERGYVTNCDYNSLDQETRWTCDPTGVIGPESIKTDFSYDAGGLLERVDEDHRSSSGVADGANPRYTTYLIRDSATCPLAVSIVAVENRPVTLEGVPVPARLADLSLLGLSNFSVSVLTFDAIGACVESRCPAACIDQPNDIVVACSYDERGLPFECVEGAAGTPSAIKTRFDYSPACDVTRCTVVGGPTGSDVVTTCAYDGFRRLHSCVDPMGNEEQFDYDSEGYVTCSLFGQLEDVAGSSGNVLMSRCKLPLEQFVKCLSSGFGTAKSTKLCLSYFDEKREDDSMTFSRFTPGSSTPEVVETTVCDRSAAGLIMNVVRNGVTLASCTYDSAGRLVSCTDGACSVTLSPDACGNVIAATRIDLASVPGGSNKTYSSASTFDALGRCVSSSSGGRNENWIFDSFDRLSQYSVTGRAPLRCAYDGGNVAGPFSAIIEADVDGDGDWEPLRSVFYPGGLCKSITDSTGYVTNETLDSLGRCVRVDYADGTFETAAFDALGRCTQVQRQNGAVLLASYDAAGRTVQLVCTDASSAAVPSTVCVYNGMGLCTQLTQGSSSIHRAFDSCGNLLSESQNGQTVQYDYANQACIRRVYDGVAYDQTVDSQGRLTAIVPAGATTPVASFTYSGHRVATESRGNGVSTSYEYRAEGDAAIIPGDLSYDACVRSVVTGANGIVLSTTTWVRDAAGGCVGQSCEYSNATDPPLRRHQYTLDRLGRVTGERVIARTAAGGQLALVLNEVFSLDIEGNRLSTTGGRNPGLYTMNDTIPPGDRQMGQYTTWPRGAVGWNDNGSLTSLGGATPLTFVYDALQRPVSVSSSGQEVATFTYDAYNRIRTRTLHISGQAPVTSTFFYDGSACIKVTAVDGQADFSSAPMRLCLLSRNGTYVYPHSHVSGTYITNTCAVRMVSSSTGQPMERVDFDHAGHPVFLTGEGVERSGATNSLSLDDWLCPDTLWCPETSSHHSGAALHSPALGQRVNQL